MKKIKMDVVMALALNALLVLLLLPMLYCSTADVATGDDLLNGAVVYHVLQDGGSMVDVLRAVGAYIVENYRTWQGTWSSIFLFCFAPVNWGRGDVCDRAVDRDFHRAGGNLGADAGISG